VIRSVGVYAIHLGIQAAAAVVRLTFVQVPAADSISGQAGGTGSTGEATRQIDAAGGTGLVGRRIAALVHILATNGGQSVGLPTRLTEATIAGIVEAGNAGSVATQLPGTRLRTVGLALGAVHPMPTRLAQATVGAKLILALSSILAAQVGALVQGALVDVQLALGALRSKETK